MYSTSYQPLNEGWGMGRFISWYFCPVTLADTETFDIHKCKKSAGAGRLKWSRSGEGGHDVGNVCYNPKSSFPSHDQDIFGAFCVSSSIFDITRFSTGKKIMLKEGDPPDKINSKLPAPLFTSHITSHMPAPHFTSHGRPRR